MRFSIIINNFNYGHFVGQAIESALAVDWPDKETIVVDDGSSDNSRSVIATFGDRVIAIFTANGGQARAGNAGFERSTGEVIIFLDADDVLLPTVAQKVAKAWRPGVVKVQYGMIFVDPELRPLGVQWPVYTERHTPELIARWMRQTGDYPSSPTTGNAWARGFLDEVFPLPTRDQGLQMFDTYLNKLAPFFGDVVSLTSPQCLHRRHTDNYTGLSGTEKYLDRYPRAINELDAILTLANELLLRKGRPDKMRYRSEHYARLALIAKRFFSGPPPGRLVTLLVTYWRRTLGTELYSPRQKVLLLFWSFVVVAMPRRIARLAVMSRERHAKADAGGLRRLLAIARE